MGTNKHRHCFYKFFCDLSKELLSHIHFIENLQGKVTKLLQIFLKVYPLFFVLLI